MAVDHIDKKILQEIQRDTTLSLQEIGDRVGLSATPCWRRLQKLERDGYIDRRVAILNRAKLNVDVTVFVAVKTSRHTAEWLDKFRRAVADMDEVVEMYRLSGEIDYLLRIILPDIKAYDAFYQRLIHRIDLTDVSSMFAMEEIKSTTEIPLTYVD